MKPSQVVTYLHKIATTIERSKNPDRCLVAKDIKHILAILLNEQQSQDYDNPLWLKDEDEIIDMISEIDHRDIDISTEEKAFHETVWGYMGIDPDEIPNDKLNEVKKKFRKAYDKFRKMTKLERDRHRFHDFFS